MGVADLRAILPGASALIKALCDELDMAGVIDGAVRWDPAQCKLSPGTRIVALVVNALVHRRPLYRVEKFYAAQDVALLFGPGVQADDFNDDALARALDDLAAANPRAIFSQVAMHALLRDGIEVRTLHADTTLYLSSRRRAPRPRLQVPDPSRDPDRDALARAPCG